MRDSIYAKSGKWLPIVSLAEKTDKSIVIRIAEKDSTPEDSFRVYVKGTTLYFKCEYEYCFVERMDFAITKFIGAKVSDVEYKQSKDHLYKEDRSFITYEQCGAKGDGKTNDFEAIRNAHLKANDHGLVVEGNSKATYYISNTVINGEVRTIFVTTPTDWQGAKFIIDDSDPHQTDTLEQHLKPVFTVQLEAKEVEVKATAEQLAAINAGEKLGSNTKKIDLGLGHPAMLMITNTNHKVYIRYGHNANDGNSQHELVVVDAAGNIKEGAELLLDYETFTGISIYTNDCEEIEIKNSNFTTIASKKDTTVGDTKIHKGIGFSRNLLIKRSNTVVSNVNHYMQGEITAEQHK